MSEEFLLKFKGEISGKEDLDRYFDAAESGAKRVESRLQRIGGALSAVSSRAKSELDSFAGKELGGSFGSEARGVLQLRDAINQLAVSSGGGNEMMEGLRSQIHQTSTAANQLQDSVTDALQAFVEKTGDINTARQNLLLYAKTATATSSAVKDLALVGVELSDKLNVKNQAQSFAILATQAKAGAIELKDLATKGPRLFAAVASAGATGEQAVREGGALAQTYAKGFGGTGASASVITAIENTFSDILKKSARLEAAGIKVQGRDQFEVLKDIIRATGGDKGKLLEVFNARAIRGVDVLAREYRQTGGFGTFDKFRDIQADPSVIDRDFATRNSTGLAKLRATQVQRQRFYDEYLGGIAEWGAGNANVLQAGAFGLGIAGKGLSLLGRVGGAFGGRLGAAVGQATASRVFVVNWPGGFGGGVPGTPGAPGGAFGGTASALGIGGAVLGLGLYGIEKLKQAGDERLDAVENAGVEINRHQLALKKQAAERASLVRDYEAKGWSHGKALFAADQDIKAAKAEIKNLTVVINDGQAHVETDEGTRSPKVMVKRGGGG